MFAALCLLLTVSPNMSCLEPWSWFLLVVEYFHFALTSPFTFDWALNMKNHRTLNLSRLYKSHKGPVVVWQTLAKMLACAHFLSATMWAWSFRNVGMCIFSLCNIASSFQNVSICIFSATAWASSFTNLGGNNFHWVPYFHTSSRIISMSQGCQKGNIGDLLDTIQALCDYYIHWRDLV